MEVVGNDEVVGTRVAVEVKLKTGNEVEVRFVACAIEDGEEAPDDGEFI